MPLPVNQKESTKKQIYNCLKTIEKQIIGIWQRAPKGKNIGKLTVFYISARTSMVGWMMVPPKMSTS